LAITKRRLSNNTNFRLWLCLERRSPPDSEPHTKQAGEDQDPPHHKRTGRFSGELLRRRPRHSFGAVTLMFILIHQGAA